ncbi:MAG: hypothetical protein ACI8QS_001084 [Planctomycetota bacterium]|jgi:hypothetical protein
MTDPEEERSEGQGFRPRKHDHLVEPMFEGLGVGEQPSGEEQQPRVPWFVRLLKRIAGLWR